MSDYKLFNIQDANAIELQSSEASLEKHLHAVEQINRNIELIRYRKFDETHLMLDFVNASSVANKNSTSLKTEASGKTSQKVFLKLLARPSKVLLMP